MEGEMEGEMEGIELPDLLRTESFTALSPKTKIKRYRNNPKQRERAIRKKCPKELADIERELEASRRAALDNGETWIIDIDALRRFQDIHERCDIFRNNPDTPLDNESVGIHTPDAEWGETKGETKGEGSRRTKRREHKRRKKTSRRKLRRGKKTKGKPHRSKPKKKTRGKRRN